LFQYGESLFGVKPPNEDGDKDEDDEDVGDIEASIEKELASMAQPKPKTKQTFTPIGTGLDCVFFMKTVKPVDPLELVTKASQDARDCPDPMQRKTKYINRLTPIFDTDKATDKGIERVARSVMEPHFELKSESAEDASAEPAAPEQDGEGSTACTVSRQYDSRKASLFEADDDPFSTPSGITSGITPPSNRVR
jgi:tRNA acetyltransferase TAN1